MSVSNETPEAKYLDVKAVVEFFGMSVAEYENFLSAMLGLTKQYKGNMTMRVEYDQRGIEGIPF